MVDYREGKERYIPNKLGSLYINTSKLDNKKRPIIYIGGQMEHRCHVLEQTGKTMDVGHNMFTGNWFYDYSILTSNKSKINGEGFADNLESGLEMANLYDVDLITHSFSGIIGALASKSERIHKVYAIHPPITGTPLANPSYFDKYKELLTKKERLLLRVLKTVVNNNYGFEHDSFTGVDLSKVDLNKLLVIGSNIDPETEADRLSLELYNMIKKVTGLENDGVVTFEEDIFNKLGINYVKEDNNYNHFNFGTEESLKNAYRLSLRK